MSILIKGMEMPKSCAKCKLFGEDGCPFVVVGYAYTEGRRNERCPLIEVPEPHGRLIDADKLNVVNDRPHEIALMETDNIQEVLEKWIGDAPTVIEAEEGE